MASGTRNLLEGIGIVLLHLYFIDHHKARVGATRAVGMPGKKNGIVVLNRRDGLIDAKMILGILERVAMLK